METCFCDSLGPPAAGRQGGFRSRPSPYRGISDGGVVSRDQCLTARQGLSVAGSGAPGVLRSLRSSAGPSSTCRARTNFPGFDEVVLSNGACPHLGISTRLAPPSASTSVVTPCSLGCPRLSSFVGPVASGGGPSCDAETGIEPFGSAPFCPWGKNSFTSPRDSMVQLSDRKISPNAFFRDPVHVLHRNSFSLGPFSAYSSYLSLLLSLFVIQLFPSAFLCEGRMIVTYPDTLANYPPIVETYFAPWSQNFTSTSGRLRYFARTCDLDHYFYLDEADLDGYPISKERHALHGLDFSDSSLALSLPGGGTLEDKELSLSRENEGLLRGALRRLQEAFPAVGRVPWVWWRPTHDSFSVFGASLFPGGSSEVDGKQGSQDSGSAVKTASSPPSDSQEDGISGGSIPPDAGQVRGSVPDRVSPFLDAGQEKDAKQEYAGGRGALFRFLLSRKHPGDPPQVRSKLQSKLWAEGVSGGIDELSLPAPGSQGPSGHPRRAAPSLSGCLNCGDQLGPHPRKSRVSSMYRWAASPVTYLGNLSSYMPFSFRSPPAQYVLFRKGATDASGRRGTSSVSSFEASPGALLHGDAVDEAGAGPVSSQNSSTLPSVSDPSKSGQRQQQQAEGQNHGSEAAEEHRTQQGRSGREWWPSASGLWEWLCSFSRIRRGEQSASSLSPFVLLNTLVSPAASVVAFDAARKTDVSPPFSGRFIAWPTNEAKEKSAQPVLTTSAESRQLHRESVHLSAWMPSSAFRSDDFGVEDADSGKRGGKEVAKESGAGKHDSLFLSNRAEEGSVGDEKVLWLFDQCNDATAVQRLVNAANSNHAGALIFTNTTFSDPSSVTRFPKGGIDGLKQLAFSPKLSPRPTMPVFSIPESRLTREIKDRLRSGDTVEVLVDTLPADYVNCALLEPVKWASLAFIPLWGGLTLLWYLMCNYVSRFDVSPLHRLLLLPPVLKTAFLVTAFGFYAQCPDYLGNSTQYIMMAYMGLNTIFNTIFYGIFLLLAKGFMITREVFGRKESLSLALLVSTTSQTLDTVVRTLALRGADSVTV